MSNNKKQRMITVVTLIMALVICLVPFSMVNAKAAVSPPEDRPEGCSMYYFTDKPVTLQQARSLADVNPGIDTDKVHLYTYVTSDTYPYFEKWFYVMLQAVEVADGSYVIVEISNGFLDYGKVYGGKFFTEYLEQVFRGWKDGNCKIMFICGTEEVLYRDYNAFLDYTDIHINIDGIMMFVYNVFYRIFLANNGEAKWTNLNFIVDYWFMSDYSYLDGWFNFHYFEKYLMKVYLNEIRLKGYNDFKAYWMNNNGNGENSDHININEYVQTSTGMIDYLGYYSEVTNYEMHDNENVFAMCSTENQYFEEWCEIISSLQGEYLEDLPVYIYNPRNLGLSECGLDNVYAFNGFLSYSNVIEAFLNDDNLLPYDNWGGRCQVTHKPISSGANGWLINLFDESFAEFIRPIYEIPEE